jgi:hypothetical protein
MRRLALLLVLLAVAGPARAQTFSGGVHINGNVSIGIDSVPPPPPADDSCAGQLPINFTGTQYADCFTPLIRGSELVAGLDQGLGCPGDSTHALHVVTDGVTNGTTTITSATAAWGTDVLGKTLHVSGGTGSITAAKYQILLRNSASSVTVDRATGLTTGTGASMQVGGNFPNPACGQSLQAWPALAIYHSLQVGVGASGTTWLARFDTDVSATGEWCVDGLDVMANGRQMWGPVGRMTLTAGSPTTGSFIAAYVQEGKAEDAVHVVKGDITNLATGAITYTTLATLDLAGAILAYGGLGATGRCCYAGLPDSTRCWKGPGYQDDNACHANLWWVSACLKIEDLGGGTERYTATAGIRGSGTQIDPSRASPYSTISTTYTAVYTGARPAGIAATGDVGIALRTVGGVPTTSVTNFRLGPP